VPQESSNHRTYPRPIQPSEISIARVRTDGASSRKIPGMRTTAKRILRVSGATYWMTASSAFTTT